MTEERAAPRRRRLWFFGPVVFVFVALSLTGSPMRHDGRILVSSPWVSFGLAFSAFVWWCVLARRETSRHVLGCLPLLMAGWSVLAGCSGSLMLTTLGWHAFGPVVGEDDVTYDVLARGFMDKDFVLVRRTSIWGFAATYDVLAQSGVSSDVGPRFVRPVGLGDFRIVVRDGWVTCFWRDSAHYLMARTDAAPRSPRAASARHPTSRDHRPSSSWARTTASIRATSKSSSARSSGT